MYWRSSAWNRGGQTRPHCQDLSKNVKIFRDSAFFTWNRFSTYSSRCAHNHQKSCIPRWLWACILAFCRVYSLTKPTSKILQVQHTHKTHSRACRTSYQHDTLAAETSETLIHDREDTPEHISQVETASWSVREGRFCEFWCLFCIPPTSRLIDFKYDEFDSFA